MKPLCAVATLDAGVHRDDDLGRTVDVGIYVHRGELEVDALPSAPVEGVIDGDRLQLCVDGVVVCTVVREVLGADWNTLTWQAGGVWLRDGVGQRFAPWRLAPHRSRGAQDELLVMRSAAPATGFGSWDASAQVVVPAAAPADASCAWLHSVGWFTPAMAAVPLEVRTGADGLFHTRYACPAAGDQTMAAQVRFVDVLASACGVCAPGPHTPLRELVTRFHLTWLRNAADVADALHPHTSVDGNNPWPDVLALYARADTLLERVRDDESAPLVYAVAAALRGRANEAADEARDRYGHLVDAALAYAANPQLRDTVRAQVHGTVSGQAIDAAVSCAHNLVAAADQFPVLVQVAETLSAAGEALRQGRLTWVALPLRRHGPDAGGVARLVLARHGAVRSPGHGLALIAANAATVEALALAFGSQVDVVGVAAARDGYVRAEEVLGRVAGRTFPSALREAFAEERRAAGEPPPDGPVGFRDPTAPPQRPGQGGGVL